MSQNDQSLLILTPMQEENIVVYEMLADIGYTKNDIENLVREKKFFVQQTGIGAISTMNFIYNFPQAFEKNNLNILLMGFAGALSHDLGIGQSCHIGAVSHFSFIDCQEAGDFEIITTPSFYFTEELVTDAQDLSIPHIRLTPSALGQEKLYNLISVPALLQGEKTKQRLNTQGIDVVDMEGFSLASALQHIRRTHTNKNIQLDMVRVITDSPSEKFEFSKLEEYKNHLRKSELIHSLLQSKMANF